MLYGGFLAFDYLQIYSASPPIHPTPLTGNGLGQTAWSSTFVELLRCDVT